MASERKVNERLRVKVGPFEFEFESDGQDGGVGMVRMTGASFMVETPDDIPREDWDRFERKLRGL